MRDENLIKLAGQVIDEPRQVEIESQGSDKKLVFDEFKLKVTRLSGESDILPVTVEHDENSPIKKDDFVEVSGELRGIGKTIDGKFQLDIYVRGHKYATKSSPSNKNQLFLEGYITRPVCHRITPLGREIADIFIANNDKSGNTNYLPCIVWGKNALFAQDLPVGSRIQIEGRLQSREYKKIIDGVEQRRTICEISGRLIALVQESTKTKTIGD